MNMQKNEIISEIPGLFRLLRLVEFRKTPGVRFDILPSDALSRIDAVDRVLHDTDAVSPGPVSAVRRPWYMHPHQDDNLMVLSGTRFVELYTGKNGSIERFEVTAGLIKREGTVIHDGPVMLTWPRGVFHRITSGKEGSASVNFAVRYPGFDIRTNFDIYDLDTDSGAFQVIRQGFTDQFQDWEVK